MPPGRRVVYAGTLPASLLVEQSLPAPTASDHLEWISNSALQPVARLLNTAKASSLQHWLALAGIALGLLTGLVTAGLYDYLRTGLPLSHLQDEARRATMFTSAATPTSSGPRLALVGGVAVTVMVILRLARR